MRLNGRCCVLCGELHGGNLRMAGREICEACEGALVRGALLPEAVLPNLRRFSGKVRCMEG